VRDHAERLRERPRRERVRRVARVHERELRCEPLVGEVGVERLELERRDHALVDERAARQRGEVQLELALRALAQAERQPVQREPLEVLALGRARGAAHVELLHDGHGGTGERAELVGADGDLAPSEHVEALGCRDPLQLLLDAAARGGVDREERIADGVVADRRQREPGDLAEERVGDLRDDARTVAGAGVGADRTAMLEVAERVERGRDDVVAGGAAQGRDHGEAARVLLCGRVVHALRGRHGSEPGVGRGERHV
jgi:hypothetical protein